MSRGQFAIINFFLEVDGTRAFAAVNALNTTLFSKSGIEVRHLYKIDSSSKSVIPVEWIVQKCFVIKDKFLAVPFKYCNLSV